MSGTTTPNYHFSLPAIGGNQDTWGNLLNANWTAADSAIHTLASGYLPATGGTINGNLAVTGGVSAGGNMSATGSMSAAAMGTSGAVSAGTTLSCGTSLSIGVSGVTDFQIYRSGGDRVLQWGKGYNIAWNETDGGSVTWQNPSIQQMALDPFGNLSVHGTVHGTNVLLAGGLDVGDILRDLLARVADLEALRLA
jgi:hypothetical protein